VWLYATATAEGSTLAATMSAMTNFLTEKRRNPISGDTK
jgi:preprotein translocase subunit SecA